jgi:2-dehydro-3-deoxyphosphogluconate aldolase/(4S)-4-hydroxy-2-oxoglutarate aldolase
MSDTQATIDAIADSGVTAVLRGIDEDDILSVARAIHEGGVRSIELTADATHYPDMIAAVERELADTDAIVGAGTVMDAAAARDVIAAGAEFVLAPNVNEAVIETCNRAGVVSVPGVMTPTEADRAMAAGADALKLFPASTVGPGHVGALRGPLGDVRILPTGGVSPENVAEYFEAGAFAVGAGSALVNDDAIEREDWDAVRESAAEFVAAVEDARQ